jgi:hypothetical protein
MQEVDVDRQWGNFERERERESDFRRLVKVTGCIRHIRIIRGQLNGDNSPMQRGIWTPFRNRSELGRYLILGLSSIWNVRVPRQNFCFQSAVLDTRNDDASEETRAG